MTLTFGLMQALKIGYSWLPYGVSAWKYCVSITPAIFLQRSKSLTKNSPKNVRWKQRLLSFSSALDQLRLAVQLAKSRPLTDLEKQGLIHGFEFTHELSWNLLRDFLRERGVQEIYGSKDATREAFSLGLIQHGEVWMAMIESRNLSSHTYSQETADEIAKAILTSYFSEFETLEALMKSKV